MKLPISPNRDLGQHFLVDENILGVIGRLAALEDDDVVLEVGPGLGVLTAYLAERVARVHAVELDRSLEPHLAERLAGHANVDSALVAFRRTRGWGPEFAHLKEIVQGAFAHRRKTLANSLELSRGGRAEAEAALERLGLPQGIRAEALAPEQFLQLAELLP